MPRLKPPTGYMTSKEATELLGVSDSTLSVYVKQGHIHRYGPPQRKHKFYRRSEIEAFHAARTTFEEYQERTVATFERASALDIPTIVEIDNRIFEAGVRVETYARWLVRNPDTFFVLREKTRHIVGYGCLLPLSRELIDRFCRDEIPMEDITADDVELFEPGKPLHLYCIALGVDPVYTSNRVKRQYGARLITGLFAFLYDLADKGVEIATITARNQEDKPDGFRLLHDLGIPQLHSPVEHKYLFQVEVAPSGLDFLEKYKKRLELAKQKQQQRKEQ